MNYYGEPTHNNFSKEQIETLKDILTTLNQLSDDQKRELHIGSLVVRLLTNDGLLWSQIDQVQTNTFSMN
ncbi:MAG: hypothetical protein KDE52_06955 [Calditrichaeota bacterium]|nr:hypothetical protein [Calditrichota bacterium]MCB0268386.1 hypothetical protein [Calditrichota bacterium]MCB0286098.1 hypothetical protein [Calditrichota bacterium]MCB0299776.1 hypothetical protein [Calditrichota bacterium]MCB9069607.1 hypothetical protein [Calditrichia bacterium]